jgi:zinc metalloprotease ZmpB
MKRYPIMAGQDQDGVLAGQLTIEITAIKESEDYVYGNMRSLELHTFNCNWRKKMSPHNQRPFQTIKDALARGYNGCKYCLPKYSNE